MNFPAQSIGYIADDTLSQKTQQNNSVVYRENNGSSVNERPYVRHTNNLYKVLTEYETYCKRSNVGSDPSIWMYRNPKDFKWPKTPGRENGWYHPLYCVGTVTCIQCDNDCYNCTGCNACYDHNNTCTGCTNGCTTGCTAACTGSCTTGCTNGCTGSCTTNCTTSCTGSCTKNCTTSCTTNCTASCQVDIYSETCTEACTTGCNSGCTTGCNVACTDECNDGCTTGCNDCTGNVGTTCIQCDGEVEIIPDCKNTTKCDQITAGCQGTTTAPTCVECQNSCDGCQNNQNCSKLGLRCFEDVSCGTIVTQSGITGLTCIGGVTCPNNNTRTYCEKGVVANCQPGIVADVTTCNGGQTEYDCGLMNVDDCGNKVTCRGNCNTGNYSKSCKLLVRDCEAGTLTDDPTTDVCISCDDGCNDTCVGCDLCVSSCNEGCTTGCTLACTTGCTRNCTTQCTTGCTRSCTTGCTSQCTTSCTTGCTSSCASGCTSSCTTSCTTNCTTSCTRSCTTNCTTGCTSSCASSCDTGCVGCTTSCTGGCISSCASGCTTGCTRACTTGCTTNCTTSCTTGCTKSCVTSTTCGVYR